MRKKIILLIFGSQVLMDMTKKILERVGYGVRCAIGPSGALEQLQDFTPDGVIIENELPDVKGLELCKDLRTACLAPIMLISVEKDDELPALQAGANDFLKKPIDYDILKARLGVMLNANIELTVGYKTDAIKRNGIFNTGKSNDTQRQNIYHSNPKGNAFSKKPAMKTALLYAAGIACVATALIGFVIYNMMVNGKGAPENAVSFEITDDQVPLASAPLPDANARPYAGPPVPTAAGPGYIIVEYGDISFPAGGEEIPLVLFNPETNQCGLTFELTLMGTGEVLYMSELIEPGKYVGAVTFNRELEKGEYRAALFIRAYAAGTFAELAGSVAEFSITII